MKEIFVGKTVDDAKSAAALAFSVNEADISFLILEEPKKGFLGITKGEARVEASYEPTKGHMAEVYLRTVLGALGIGSEISSKEVDGGLEIQLLGANANDAVGRRGETLDALQYLTSMSCNKNDRDYYRITLDTSGYREKRRVELEGLAVKVANSVLKNGRTSALEPMNPYERRIIHSAVSTVAGVASRSVGEEPYRKVIISSLTKNVDEAKPARRDFPNSNANTPRANGAAKPGGTPPGRSEKPAGKRDFKPAPPRKVYEGDGSTAKRLDLSTSFEKEYKKPVPKPHPEDEILSELYGKVEI